MDNQSESGSPVITQIKAGRDPSGEQIPKGNKAIIFNRGKKRSTKVTERHREINKAGQTEEQAGLGDNVKEHLAAQDGEARQHQTAQCRSGEGKTTDYIMDTFLCHTLD